MMIQPAKVDARKLQLAIVYDNIAGKAGFVSDWGFSCMIRGMRRTVLFDTGTTYRILAGNMKKLGIRPDSVDLLFISHGHRDHSGGALEVLSANPGAALCVPEAFPSGGKKKARSLGHTVVEVDRPQKLAEGMFSTGQMKTVMWPAEQSLVIRTNHGLVIVTGCSHPGVAEIVERARKIIPEDVLLLIGGFHLGDHSESDVRKIVSRLQALHVSRVCPAHCSGPAAQKVMGEVYQKRCLPAGAGSVISLSQVLSL